MTQPGHEPSKDWLAFVKTSRARNKIKHVINASERLKAIEIGEKYLEKEARRLGVQLGKVSKARPGTSRRRVRLQQDGRPVCRARLWQVFRAPGAEQDGARQIVKEEPSTPSRPRRRRRHVPLGHPGRPHDSDAVIKVRGIDDLMVYRAKCCNPIRGEAIVGYVTRGKGVAVHSKACPNVQNLMYDVERKIEVEWARAADETFPRAHRGAHRRPARHAQPAHLRALRRKHQHPQPGSQDRTRARTAAWWK